MTLPLKLNGIDVTGQTFIDGNCSGEPLELNWLDAQSFAREFSESSGNLEGGQILAVTRTTKERLY